MRRAMLLGVWAFIFLRNIKHDGYQNGGKKYIYIKNEWKYFSFFLSRRNYILRGTCFFFLSKRTVYFR